MAKKFRRLKPGDVLEMQAGNGFSYLQYLGKHEFYGDAILVCPTVHATKQAVLTTDFFASGYVTFYPAAAAVIERLVDVVGHLVPPMLPKCFRRPGAVIGRVIETWIIECETGIQVKNCLSDDELKLPIASIWNHEYLIRKVLEGWKPEMDGQKV